MATTTTTTTTTTVLVVGDGGLTTLERVVLLVLKAPAGTTLTRPLLLTMGIIWRQSRMWLVYLDYIDSLPGRLTHEMIVRSSGCRGQLVEDFISCGCLVCTVPNLGNRNGKMPEVDEATRTEIESLSLCFQDIAKAYLTFNFGSFGDAQTACVALLDANCSMLDVAQLRIDALVHSFVRRGGGNEKKFVASKCLNKEEFAWGDRDALSKAMTVRERFTAGDDSSEEGRNTKRRRKPQPKKDGTGGGAQQPKTCHYTWKAPHVKAGQKCGASFTGAHKAHCVTAGHPTS